MDAKKPIIPLIPRNALPSSLLELVSPNAPAQDSPSNISFLVPRSGEPTYRLVDGAELIQTVRERLAMKLDRSSLCRLRASGMPFVPFSARQIRYDLATCLEWLILRSYRKDSSGKMDPLKLLASFGLVPDPHGAA